MGIGGCQDWSTGLDGRELGGPAVAQLLEWCLSVVFCGPKDVTAKSEGFKSTFFVETSRIMHLSQHFHVFPLSDCVESLKGFLLSGMGFSRQLGHSGRFLPLHAPCGWQRLAKVGKGWQGFGVDSLWPLPAQLGALCCRHSGVRSRPWPK